MPKSEETVRDRALVKGRLPVGSQGERLRARLLDTGAPVPLDLGWARRRWASGPHSLERR
jgi:hypothetical protein